MARSDIPPETLDRISKVTNVRARRLLELIVEHGEVTTEELTQEYGYSHPPRAKKDAMDLGFPIVARSVRSENGSRTISAYSLDLNAAVVAGRTGRKQFSKAFRAGLLARARGRCEVCGASQVDRALQIDHRVPHEIDPGSGLEVMDEFQMLCASCNRTKSWTCEHECPNRTRRDSSLCLTCLWGSPTDYDHVAMRQRRQITLTWDDDDVARFDRYQAAASARGEAVDVYLRNLLDDE